MVRLMLAVCLVFMAGAVLAKVDYMKLYKETLEKYNVEQGNTDNPFGLSAPLDNLKSNNLGVDKKGYRVFKKNAKPIIAHNRDPSREWEAEINSFTLETDEVFKSQHLGLLNVTSAEGMRAEGMRAEGMRAEGMRAKSKPMLTKMGKIDVPDYVDNSGMLPAVKNQWSCGSCWTFAAMASLEYQVNKDRVSDKVEPIALSEQQCLDCTEYGCSGGLPADCLSWPIYHYSHVASSYNYPYEWSDTPSCRYREYKVSAMAGFKVKSVEYIYGEDNLMVAVANKNIGVLTVSVNACCGFKSFKSGVFSDPECNAYRNHAVAIVGYGKLNGIPYWRVRNSWGPYWGDGGYINIKRGVNGNNLNMCGLTQSNYYPVVGGTQDGTQERMLPTITKCSDGKQDRYRGTINTTIGNRKCQDWAKQTPHEHSSYKPEDTPYLGLDSNYCRNPSGSKAVWCYTLDPDKEWEYCNVDDCSLINWCKHEGSMIDGNLEGAYESLDTAKTLCYDNDNCTGITMIDDVWSLKQGSLSDGTGVSWTKGLCQQYPPDIEEWCKHEDSELSIYRNGYDSKDVFEEAKMTCLGYSDCAGITKYGDTNYKLRQDGIVKDKTGSTVWTKGKCGTDRTTATCADGTQSLYRGTLSTTKSGRTCQKWTEQTPHVHTQTSKQYPAAGLGDHNYCRNPDVHGNAWCYTTDSSAGWRWDNCDIPKCM